MCSYEWDNGSQVKKTGGFFLTSESKISFAPSQIVEEQLALSFAQSSGMTYFLALAQKSATNLGLKDVTKVTQKFAQTNKYLTDLNKTMETQARVVQELQDIFALAKSKGQIDPTKEGAFLNQLRLEGTHYCHWFGFVY